MPVEVEGDPIEPIRVRAAVRARLFGGEAPPLRIGRFEVGARIGVGAMGVVYAARDVELDRPVAIKVLLDRAEGAGDLRAEAQALARLRHVNVVSVHEIGAWRGLPFVAMERVEGATLRSWLAAERRGWQQIVAVFAGAARGLAAAHAAGLVHRDFKPENVLVDADGQARVVDFGLARPVDAADAATVRGTSPASGAATDRLSDAANELASRPLLSESRTGPFIAGTPAYMAPEVLRGEPASPAADQFAFGVALYEALGGTRPFHGASPEALLAAIERGERAGELAGVPRRIERVVEACLAADPAQRARRMTEVADGLEARSRRVWVVGAVAAVALAAGAGAVLASRGGQPDPCGDARAQLGTAWDAQRTAALQAAFAKSARPYARAALARSIEMLDDYANRWVAVSEASCRATHVQRSQPERVMALRATCLLDRRRRLDALVGTLASGGDAVVERAVAAISALPSVESCRDSAALAEQVPPPQDPAAAAEVEQLRDRLARANALYSTGRAAAVVGELRGLAAASDRVAHAPLAAEVHLLLGTASAVAGDVDAAGPAFERAYRDGIAGHADAVAAEAAAGLANLHGLVRERPAEGRPWLANARALVERIGGSGELAATLANVEGNLEQTAGAYAKALAAFERAYAAWRDVPGDHRIDLAGALHNQGNALALMSRHRESLAALQTAGRTWEDILGPSHPLVAMAAQNAARALRSLRRVDEALETDLRVLDVEQRLGAERPEVGYALAAVASDLHQLGRFEESLVRYREAEAAMRSALGDHPAVAGAVSNVGMALAELGRYDEARAALERALADKLRLRGDAHPTLLTTLHTLGDVGLEVAALDDARAHFARALAIGEAALGRDADDLIPALVGLAEVALARTDAATALPLLRRARTLCDAAPGREAATPEERGVVEVVLGRALVETGDRAGRELAVSSLTHLAGPLHARQRRRYQAWLAAHP